MAKDPLKNSADATSGGEDMMRSGTITGTAAKGYDECACDGSSYNKYGNRLDYEKLTSHTFK